MYNPANSAINTDGATVTVEVDSINCFNLVARFYAEGGHKLIAKNRRTVTHDRITGRFLYIDSMLTRKRDARLLKLREVLDLVGATVDGVGHYDDCEQDDTRHPRTVAWVVDMPDPSIEEAAETLRRAVGAVVGAATVRI